MKKFLGWLGGILAAFITGYAIWYFTVPHTTTFEGMVINGPEVAPLANAIVSVEFVGGANGGPFHDFTYEHGAYRLDFTGLGKVSGVTISVQAKRFSSRAAGVAANCRVGHAPGLCIDPCGSDESAASSTAAWRGDRGRSASANGGSHACVHTETRGEGLPVHDSSEAVIPHCHSETNACDSRRVNVNLTRLHRAFESWRLSE
jgi:hypothetical protein